MEFPSTCFDVKLEIRGIKSSSVGKEAKQKDVGRLKGADAESMCFCLQLFHVSTSPEIN